MGDKETSFFEHFSALSFHLKKPAEPVFMGFYWHFKSMGRTGFEPGSWQPS
jgi:hypothetical protein